MKSLRLDRSISFLVIILLILIVVAGVLFYAMRSDPIKESLSGDNLLKVLVVLVDEGQPIATQVIAYYPGSKRAAMFDIPGETGLILQGLGRVDRIDALYVEKGINAYKKEIEKITGISVPFYIVFELGKFSRLADLLSGFNVFIPSPIDHIDGEKRILLPSGAVTLDGDKLRTFVTYNDPNDQEGEAWGRKQRAVLSFFSALNDNSISMFGPRLFPAVASCMDVNIHQDSLKELLLQLSNIDSERLVPQRVTGSLREVDGKNLLFPFYDGQLLKDIIRQTLGSLASTGSASQERIYALEILNGTRNQGLARNTSELYQSFGYDVIRIGNAENTDYKNTVVIDRIGNSSVAKSIAHVIQCDVIESTELVDSGDYGTEAIVDFTIVLGADFNGRYVR